MRDFSLYFQPQLQFLYLIEGLNLLIQKKFKAAASKSLPTCAFDLDPIL